MTRRGHVIKFYIIGSVPQDLTELGNRLGPREFCVCVLRGCVCLRFDAFRMRSFAFSSVRVRGCICVKWYMNASENLSYRALPKYLDFLTVYSIIPSWQVPKSGTMSI